MVKNHWFKSYDAATELLHVFISAQVNITLYVQSGTHEHRDTEGHCCPDLSQRGQLDGNSVL